MRVQCQSCETKLNIPDDKLIPGAEFSFNCPKCKTRNSLAVPSDDAVQAQGISLPSQGPENPVKPPQSRFEAEDIHGLGEFYEEGAKLALICFDEGPLRTKLSGIIKNLGYVPVIPSSTRDALRRLRLNQFDAVFIHENYEGAMLESNAVLHFIQPMEMTRRRRMVAALFSNSFNTFDHMNAYALSLNALVNLADEEHFEKILERALAEHNRFYKVMFEVMSEIGKG